MLLIFWLWRLGSWCAGHLPRRAGHRLAMGVGSLAYMALRGPRRNAAANYAQVMGKQADDAQVGRVTRGAFQNFALYLLDVMRYPSHFLGARRTFPPPPRCSRIARALRLSRAMRSSGPMD